MVLRNGKYFQAEIVLLLQTLSRFYCLSSKPLREGRNTLWHYFNQCCLKRRSLVSDFIFLWVQICHAFPCMPHHLQFMTLGRSGGQWSLLLLLPYYSCSPDHPSSQLGTGSIPRHWCKPWRRHPTAVCASQQGCPKLSLPSLTSYLLSTGAWSTNISRVAPPSYLHTSSQPLYSLFLVGTPKVL